MVEQERMDGPSLDGSAGVLCVFAHLCVINTLLTHYLLNHSTETTVSRFNLSSFALDSSEAASFGINTVAL